MASKFKIYVHYFIMLIFRLLLPGGSLGPEHWISFRNPDLKYNIQSVLSSEPDFSDLKVELLRAGLGLSKVLGSDGFPANLRCRTL